MTDDFGSAPAPDLTTPLTDADAAQAWIEACVGYIGGGFHPDTSAAEYVEGTDRKPMFGSDDAQRFDERMEEAFDLLGSAGTDPYAVALEAVTAADPDLYG